MVSPSLRQFLQSLCCTSPWDYAVLWKLQLRQGQALLTWDDGVFDISKPREPIEAVIDSVDLYCPDDRLFSTFPLITQSGRSVVSPIPELVAEMSSIYYLAGTGVVGEVAPTETSRWIYAEKLMYDGFNYDSMCPDELLHQFVAGIKTILLIPLVPYGVLQLGSLNKVAEDAELITCIKNKFVADQQFAGYISLFSSERKYLVQSPPHTSGHIQYIGELAENAVERTNKGLVQSPPHTSGHIQYIGELSENAVERTNKGLSNLANIAVESNGMLNVNEMMRKVGDWVSESKICLEPGGEFDVTEHFTYPFHEHGESDMKQNFSQSAFLDEDLDVFSYFTDYEMMHSKISVNEIMGATPNRSGEPLVVSDCDYSTYKSGEHFLRFPSDCELNKVLGTVVSDSADLDGPCLDYTREDSGRTSVCNIIDNIHCSQPSAWDCGERSEEGYKVDDLLEAVLANASSIANDNTSNRSPSAMSSKASPGNLGSYDIAHVISNSEELVPCVTSASSCDKDSRKNSPSKSSFNCVISALLEEQQQREVKGTMRASKRLKPRGANKRTQTGDKRKPRPRDRQLIQDRIKALRELVPSSEKCSIDSLLEKTVKHMRFLRSVTHQADKVKHQVKHKAFENKTFKSHAKGNDRNGTSWAVELGGEQEKFPIVVKDLEYPGHMLIEMLCSDHGRFLEIADAIHRLKLTILKSLMEKRSDECTWAHFIVEASGSFHRLDIFWPLMQLLQQN